MEIYFKATEIYFQATEKVFVARREEKQAAARRSLYGGAEKFVPCGGEALGAKMTRLARKVKLFVVRFVEKLYLCRLKTENANI